MRVLAKGGDLVDRFNGLRGGLLVDSYGGFTAKGLVRQVFHRLLRWELLYYNAVPTVTGAGPKGDVQFRGKRVKLANRSRVKGGSFIAIREELSNFSPMSPMSPARHQASR